MLQSINRTITSGGVKYDVTVAFSGMNVEQIQQDAMSFYVWKVQRVVRDADEKQRETWAKDGISIHATEAGKNVLTTEQLVNKLTPEQKEMVFAMLQKERVNG